MSPRRRIYFVLAALALGGALVLFPYLGLLGLPILFVAAAALFAILLRLGTSHSLSQWRTVSGVVLLFAGTVALILATLATPAGFLTPGGPTLLMKIDRYHLTVPIRFLLGRDRLGPLSSFSIPALCVGSASPLALGAGWTARLSFSAAVQLCAAILAVFPVCALLFLALLRVWPLTD
jgi:hypothetical protein